MERTGIVSCQGSGRRIGKAVTAILALLVIGLLFAQSSLACTSVVIGSDASDDGSAIIARSNDT